MTKSGSKCFESDSSKLESETDSKFIRVAVGLGANLGDPVETIRKAVFELEQKGLSNTRLSSFFLTAPVDCVPGTPDFINAAVRGDWPGTPRSLLDTCHSIERKLGRPSEHAKDEARVIDLDILLIEDHSIDEGDLKVPHPQLLSRLFALVPLAEIAGDWTIVVDGREWSIFALAEELVNATPDLHRRINFLPDQSDDAQDR